MINRHRLSSPSKYRRKKTLSTYRQLYCQVYECVRLFYDQDKVTGDCQLSMQVFSILSHKASAWHRLTARYYTRNMSPPPAYSTLLQPTVCIVMTTPSLQVKSQPTVQKWLQSSISSATSYLSYGVHRTNTIILAPNIARSIDLENYINWVYCTGIPKRRHQFRSNVTSIRSRRFPTSVHVVVQKM